MLERCNLAVILLFLLLAACPAAFAGAPAVPGEALVVLKNGLAEPLTEEALASMEGQALTLKMISANSSPTR